MWLRVVSTCGSSFQSVTQCKAYVAWSWLLQWMCSRYGWFLNTNLTTGSLLSVGFEFPLFYFNLSASFGRGTRREIKATTKKKDTIHIHTRRRTGMPNRQRTAKHSQAEQTQVRTRVSNSDAVEQGGTAVKGGALRVVTANHQTSGWKAKHSILTPLCSTYVECF